MLKKLAALMAAVALAATCASSAQAASKPAVKPPPIMACPNNSFLIYLSNNGGASGLSVTGNGNKQAITVVSKGGQCFSVLAVQDIPYSDYLAVQLVNSNGLCMSWNATLLEVVLVENCGNVSWNWWYPTPSDITSGAILLSNEYTGNGWCTAAFSYANDSTVTIAPDCSTTSNTDAWFGVGVVWEDVTAHLDRTGTRPNMPVFGLGRRTNSLRDATDHYPGPGSRGGTGTGQWSL
jgi:hypothetical protein